MRKTTKTIEKLKVTVKRPNGNIKVVYKTDSVRYLGTVESAQKNCIEATKEAGRGDILSFEIVEEEMPMSHEEIRELIALEIDCNFDAQDAARERDYNNDIGFHESVKFDSKIKCLRDELKSFDEKHPEIIAEIKRKEEIKTQQQIKSALNA